MSSPATVICIGMAGSGKTTFMQRLNSHIHSKKKVPYVINLDPAVLKVPFGTNIDIRDSINYKKVMEQYNLGPNGAIMTSLNLFSTKIDQVLSIVEKRASLVLTISSSTRQAKLNAFSVSLFSVPNKAFDLACRRWYGQSRGSFLDNR